VQHHNKSASTFYRKAGFHVLPRKVLLLEVRSEAVARAHRATASKRR